MSIKAGALFVGGLFAAAVGTLLATVLDDDSNDEVINKKNGQGGNQQPPLSPAQLAAKMTCQQALDALTDAELADLTEGVLGSAAVPAAGGDGLDMFALSLETAAGAPGRSTTDRAALLRLAQCVREKKAGVALGGVAKESYAASGSGGGQQVERTTYEVPQQRYTRRG